VTATDLRAAALAARVAAEEAESVAHARRRACGCRDVWSCAPCADAHRALYDACGAAWQAHAAVLPPGTAVTYTGTRADDHGPGWTVEGVSAGCLGAGYTIYRDGRTLSRVRLEHLTPEE
jgi:hypothetical protein